MAFSVRPYGSVTLFIKLATLLTMTALYLTKGREKSLLRRHPWVFSGAVQRVEGKALSGETIDIYDSQGKWLARGAYSPYVADPRTRLDFPAR